MLPIPRAAPAPALLLALALAGCASSSNPAAGSPHDASGGSPLKVDFDSDEAKLLACLDLRDHIVDLYATQYVAQQGLLMTDAEQTAFRHGWAEDLAKKGTFERFEQSCFYGLTPRRFRCGMASKTPGGIVACMQLSAR